MYMGCEHAPIFDGIHGPRGRCLQQGTAERCLGIVHIDTRRCIFCDKLGLSCLLPMAKEAHIGDASEDLPIPYPRYILFVWRHFLAPAIPAPCLR
jgi:hypothetical protein